VVLFTLAVFRMEMMFREIIFVCRYEFIVTFSLH
jgi:hypothetical protein